MDYFFKLSELEKVFAYTAMTEEKKQEHEKFKALAQIVAGGRLRL